jgi:hypothetical protein
MDGDPLEAGRTVPLGYRSESRPEKRQRDDGDVVATPVGVFACVDDNCVNEIFPDPVAKPMQVFRVGVGVNAERRKVLEERAEDRALPNARYLVFQ